MKTVSCMNSNLSKARIYYIQLNHLGEIISEAIIQGDVRKKEKELERLFNNLPKILAFCEVSRSEIELVDAVVRRC
ncbi:hypothetical protein Ferp_0475 [Ferroglobus placidus DSM 10642]|uniref:Uncharacterized protein n=1 Tax=Ferroglobus placidus (strain DSM 10642 / AEDII12DO) TaxID=589924 RepID=D3S316_FERPA|nr:hypothetical protein [Ferroglobus placidus]ADC64649.1 hypothetical protein Ferp_0475 [Ferroglobus placidus DSM 10642]